jgi:hypothetical protein
MPAGRDSPRSTNQGMAVGHKIAAVRG